MDRLENPFALVDICLYVYADTDLLGFSFTHLDGAGCMAMRDFPLLPLIGPVDISTRPTARFSHDTEIASPGFYEVTLDSGIKVDLTATARTGFARFTFPRDTDARVLLAGSFKVISDRSSAFTPRKPPDPRPSRAGGRRPFLRVEYHVQGLLRSTLRSPVRQRRDLEPGRNRPERARSTASRAECTSGSTPASFRSST